MLAITSITSLPEMTLKRFEQLEKIPNNESLARKYDLLSMQLTRKDVASYQPRRGM